MSGAMARAGLSNPSDLALRIREDEALLDELVAELTVGESYFFREREQLEFMRREVLASAPRRGASPPVRAWSAGCAAGEEAYSLAILLAELGLLRRGAVLGTDISRPRLEKARRGRYTRWSFRGVPEGTIDRWFTRSGKHFDIAPGLRAAVEFRYLNLAQDEYPSLASGVWGMDLVLCRNVLIYFDGATVERVARRLLASLGPHGWLFLGASDPPLQDIVACEVVTTGAGVAYRRAGRPLRWRPAPGRGLPPSPPLPAPPEARPAPAAAPPPAPPPPRLAEPPARPGPPPADAERLRLELRRAYGRADYDAAARLASGLSSAGVIEGEDRVLWVRALANQGRLEEAGRISAGALERHPESAELAYLHAVLLGQSGRFAEALAAARRAVYLNPGLVVAHLALADASLKRQDAERARRALRNAERLLEAMPPDEVLPASDGERAGRVLRMVRAQLALVAVARRGAHE